LAMDKRQIILETRVGSHLYGTNRPDSDEDFQGIFIPSKEDLLGVQNCSTEWSLNEKKSDTIQNQKGDIDRKFYNLKRFFHLAAEGQPGQLELFFAPKGAVVSYAPVWSKILDNIGLFLCRKSIVPFIGFALSQAHKATIKGETLNLIQDLILYFEQAYPKGIPNALTIKGAAGTAFEKDGQTYVGLTHKSALKLVTNLQGFTMVEVGGRNYDFKLKLKTFVANLKELEARYGKRARAAAENTYDYKSLMHAYRLLYEADELLRTGKITFPLYPAKISFLKTVRDGTCGDLDHWALLNNEIDRLRQEVEPKSFLPEEADHSGINKLCIEILSESLEGK
jgi:uncharacterized protein